MNKGGVVEVGTHSQLMSNQGLYYDLVTAQVHLCMSIWMHINLLWYRLVSAVL